MNEPVTVKYSLEEVLQRIENKLDNNQKNFDQKLNTFQRDVNQKLDTLQKDFDHKLDTFQKEVKQEIKDVNTKLDTIQKDVTDLKVGQTKLEEKVDGLGKRLDYQEFINGGVIIGLLAAVLGSLAKMLGWIGNP
ncbi:MAG: hypothetical protein QNJ33_16275 [Crocosphaera sp.]|nr:hypothetical protein [Crocosphaera sp.]